jgi:hypothetical protein
MGGISTALRQALLLGAASLLNHFRLAGEPVWHGGRATECMEAAEVFEA